MTRTIDILRTEHNNMDRLLCVLERELNIFNQGNRPDYEVLRAIVDYFKDYPDCCHHPKEDKIIAMLKVRDPTVAASIGDLNAAHQEGTKLLNRVAQAIESVLRDQDILRQSVDHIVRDFIDNERRHMALEEQVIFPAALRVLRPEAWTEINTEFADNQDPLSHSSLEQKFNLLRQEILQMESEAEVERHSK